MVKNSKGGSGHKKMASKGVISSRVVSKTRISLDEYEYYAFVISMLGGSNCHVMCQDGIQRLCIIRGKFRGSKGKRDNFITKGCWVLVGAREWNSSSTIKKNGEYEKCDLLEVYKDNDKSLLKTIPEINWSIFINNDLSISNSLSNNSKSNDFEFSNDNVNDEYKSLRTTSNTIGVITLTTVEEEEETIDIDDI